MSPTTIKYELERNKEDGGKSYFLYKVFDTGVRLLWERYLLRQHALEKSKRLGLLENVPVEIKEGVFRRTK